MLRACLICRKDRPRTVYTAYGLSLHFPESLTGYVAAQRIPPLAVNHRQCREHSLKLYVCLVFPEMNLPVVRQAVPGDCLLCPPPDSGLCMQPCDCLLLSLSDSGLCIKPCESFIHVYRIQNVIWLCCSRTSCMSADKQPRFLMDTCLCGKT